MPETRQDAPRREKMLRRDEKRDDTRRKTRRAEMISLKEGARHIPPTCQADPGIRPFFRINFQTSIDLFLIWASILAPLWMFFQCFWHPLFDHRFCVDFSPICDAFLHAPTHVLYWKTKHLVTFRLLQKNMEIFDCGIHFGIILEPFGINVRRLFGIDFGMPFWMPFLRFLTK